MAEYRVTQVSQQPPREWDGPHGKVYYIKVMLEGHPKPVSIGKKSADAIKVNDVVYGTIEASSMPEDKFKADPKPAFNGGGSGGGGTKREWQPRDDDAIRAQWAIGQAVQVGIATKKTDLETIEDIAKGMYAMVDKIKGGEAKADPVIDLLDTEKPIDLSDIPF